MGEGGSGWIPKKNLGGGVVRGGGGVGLGGEGSGWGGGFGLVGVNEELKFFVKIQKNKKNWGGGGGGGGRVRGGGSGWMRTKN